jgi:hypothetical protein
MVKIDSIEKKMKVYFDKIDVLKEQLSKIDSLESDIRKNKEIRETRKLIENEIILKAKVVLNPY